MAINITLGDIELRDITSIHSYASGRVVINKNFQKIKANLDLLSVMPIKDLNRLNFPETPIVGVDYVMNWNGSSYDIISATFKNTGTKWKIESDETIKVLPGYQYIVHDRLDLEGIMDLEGELVII